MKCPNCGAQIPELGKYCSYCGTEAHSSESTPVQQVHVHHYYEQEPQDARVVYVEKEVSSPKNRLVLLVLYFVLGYLGAHKFYSGKIGMGVFYALTGGGFGIGLFFDFFSILFGTPRDGQGLPILWR